YSGSIPSIPEYAETKGQNYLFYLPDIREIEQSWAGDYLQRLSLFIDLSYVTNLASELNTAPEKLQALIENQNPQRFHFNVGRIIPQMRTIIQQIWHHPYQGAIARMYLEAKVTELLILQLSQLTESGLDRAKTTLQSKSIDRVHHAREILAARLENPPSILELTRQVRLCDRTLRRGFRELFGTTIIGYLTSLRMEQAERLLREGKLSICEVANSVGYSHLGHFSAAFKRQFGITPSQCLAGEKRLKI
ncbi:MAG: AraC family transcriptional regulator, partial [Cyanobacteria bacterium J06558_2]